MAINPAKLYQLKITLLHSTQPVWRRILAGSDTTLDQLHQIIQIAMGWEDCHLHAFTSDKGEYFGPKDASDEPHLFKDESRVRLDNVLRKPKKKLRYEYDFGDSWIHEIVLEKQLPLIGNRNHVKCLEAVGACPPEDIGGIGGYEYFLQVINDPDHPEHHEMTEWFGTEHFDPAAVDIKEINAALQGEWQMFSEETTDQENGTLDQMTQFFSGQSFDPEEVLQAAIQTYMDEKQSQPIADFQGLSSNQVHRLIYSPFDCPELLQWRVDESRLDRCPLINMAKSFIARLQQGEIKLTAKGNLPPTEVRLLVTASGLYDPHEGKIRSEDDVMSVQVMRLLMNSSGLTRIQKGRLQRTKKGAERLAKSGWSPIFEEWSKIALTRLTWHAPEDNPEIPDMRIVSCFMLWLLRVHGDAWQSDEFYHRGVIRAFPNLLQNPSDKSENLRLRFAFNWRTLHLLHWLGLMEYQSESTKPEQTKATDGPTIRATPLLREIVTSPT